MPRPPHSLLSAAEHAAYVAPLIGLAQKLEDQATMLRVAPGLDKEARRLSGEMDGQAFALRAVLRKLTTGEFVQ